MKLAVVGDEIGTFFYGQYHPMNRKLKRSKYKKNRNKKNR